MLSGVFIDLVSTPPPPPQEKYISSSRGFTIDPHSLWGDIPSSAQTHTFRLQLFDMLCAADLLKLFFFPWDAPQKGWPLIQLRMKRLILNSVYVLTDESSCCPALYCIVLFITLMPLQWCHPEVMLKQGLSLLIWLAQAPHRFSQWQRNVAAGCHESGQAGEGLSWCPIQAMESISTPRGIAAFPPSGSWEGTAMLTPEIQSCCGEVGGGGGGWKEFWEQKTEQSNISGLAIPK